MSSLVFTKHNRNTKCGDWSLKGQNLAQTPDSIVYTRLYCKSWKCPVCGPKKASRLKYAIIQHATDKQLQRFLTLTLNPKNCTKEDSIKHIRKCWSKMRVYLMRKYGTSLSFISVLEMQKSGYAHLHILIDRYVEQAWLSAAWDKLGGGEMVDIRWIDIHKVSGYLSKYLTKELILNIPEGKRRFTTSRDIYLLKREKNGCWQLLKVGLEVLEKYNSNRLVSRSMSKSGVLNAITVRIFGE